MKNDVGDFDQMHNFTITSIIFYLVIKSSTS
jgi:hypothetical protein